MWTRRCCAYDSETEIHRGGTESADTVKRLHLYRPYAEEAVRFREQLDLNNPQFVPGDDPHAVVSDFSFP